MNGPDKKTPVPALDDELVRRLSHLQPLAGPPGGQAGFEAGLLSRMRPALPARFWPRVLGGCWEPVLFSLLSVLLGWDLLRIVRFLLNPAE